MIEQLTQSIIGAIQRNGGQSVFLGAIVEQLVGVLIPWILLLSPQVRRSRRALFIACSLIVGGIALNRMNVFVVGFQPPYAERSYFPAIGEMAITAALISGLILFYRICVTYFPVISSRRQEVPL